MSSAKSMIDSATGASPPRLLTRDTACSPIRFQSSIQFSTTSRRGFDYSSDVLDQQTNNIRENLVMKKILETDQTSYLSLPSSSSTSSNTTPILSSLSTVPPVSLMSLDVIENCVVNPTQTSSTTNANRRLPIDQQSRSRSDYRHRQYLRNTRYRTKKRVGSYAV